MKITVTTQDIEAGRRRDPTDCPVARALQRAGVSHFGVTGMLVMVEVGRTHTPMVLPSRVQNWILDFDWGMPVGPIEFDLPIPQLKEEHNTTDWLDLEKNVPVSERPSSENGAPAKCCGSRKRNLLPRFKGWGSGRRGILSGSLQEHRCARKPRSTMIKATHRGLD